jgi:hypothetical protein
MMVRTFLLGLVLVGLAGSLGAQEPEWLFRVPKYFRLKGGSSVFVHDKMRDAILFDGGAYDTYATFDGGASWKTIFDMKMFFIDVATMWQADRAGRWYYTGNVYMKITLNLVTEDAGETLTYLIRDTNDLPIGTRFEPLPIVAEPDVVLMDARTANEPTPEKPLGVYSSCDAGLTWQHHPATSRIAQMDMRGVGDRRFVTIDTAWRAIEMVGCSDSSISTTISATSTYVLLSNGTRVQNITFRRDSLTPGIHVFRADGSLDTVHRGITASYMGKVNDTCVVVFGSGGEILLYGQSTGFRVLDVPPVYNRFQRVAAVGFLGDRALFQTIIPYRAGGDATRWVLYNVRTGETQVHRRTNTYGTSYGLEHLSTPFDRQQLVPVSDSVWLASFLLGELIRTTDAGATWMPVDNITQDERWGEDHIGVLRLFDRGDGRMGLLNERNRFMLGTGATDWRIVLPAPFVHEFLLPSNSSSIFTRSRTQYGDGGFPYRVAYGPPSVFFPTPDVMWTSGDAVLRYDTDGRFVDTVLARKSRLLKRISPSVIASAMDSLYLSFTEGREWIYVGYSLPTHVRGAHTMRSRVGDVVLAADGSIIAGLRGIRHIDTAGELVDSVPGGLVRSRDDGNTWQRFGSGLPHDAYVTALHRSSTGTLYCIAASVHADPRYVDPFSGEELRYAPDMYPDRAIKVENTVIYRSTDNGSTWTTAFTFPERIMMPPTDHRFTEMPDGRILAVHPSAGIAISRTDGRTWSLGDPLNIGNTDVNDVVFTADGYAHLATDEGYVRILTDNILSVSERPSPSGSLNLVVHPDGRLDVRDPASWTDLGVYTIHGIRVREASAGGSCTLNGLARGVYVVRTVHADGIRTGLVMW